MYHDVHGSRPAALTPLVQRWAPIRSLLAIERAALSLVQAYKAIRLRRSAINELQRLDDHLLSDLGIDRNQIPDVADAQVAAHRR